MSFIKIPEFDFEELHGKNLKVLVSKSVDGTVVVGIDEETQAMYVLHQEINMEAPVVYNTELPSLNGRGTASIFGNKKPSTPMPGRKR